MMRRPYRRAPSLHETPRPDGLAVDTSISAYAFKRFSPFRDRWPEVLAFDDRSERLTQKQADLAAEITGLQERRAQAEAADHAAWAIESPGVELLYLARVMGTSVAQIEDTYARWLKRTDDQFRALLDGYDQQRASTGAAGG